MVLINILKKMTISKLTETYMQVLINEYSEGFTRRVILQLKPTAPRNISDEQLRAMINRFDQLKTANVTKQRIKQIVADSMADENVQTFRSTDPNDKKRLEKLALDPLDIQLYNYPQLEVIIHSFREVTKAPTENTQDANNSGAKLIYENPQTGIEIYYAATHKECEIFSRYYLPKTKQFNKSRFTWCIGEVNAPYHFLQYRFGVSIPSPASDYFVVDKTLPQTDESSVLVIMALENGTFVPTTKSNSTKSPMSFDKVVATFQPKLKGLQQYFKFHPLTDEEERINIVTNTQPERFAGLSSRNKIFYISAGKPILSKDWSTLDSDLQHGYISVRGPNAVDWGPNEDSRKVIKKRLLRLLNVFADTNDKLKSYAAISESNELARHLVDNEVDLDQDSSWEQPYWDLLDGAFKLTKKNQDVKLWKSLIDNVLKDSGHAANPNQ